MKTTFHTALLAIAISGSAALQIDQAEDSVIANGIEQVGECLDNEMDGVKRHILQGLLSDI